MRLSLADTLETSVLLCALMCLSSVNIIFICIIMFYQINSLTLTHIFSHFYLAVSCAIQERHENVYNGKMA